MNVTDACLSVCLSVTLRHWVQLICFKILSDWHFRVKHVLNDTSLCVELAIRVRV